MVRLVVFILAFVVTLPTALKAGSAEIPVPPDSRQGMNLTVYGGDLALVGETRRLSLPAGESVLAFPGVSTALQPATARVSGGPGLRVLDQVFDADLITPQALLEAHVGKEIGVVRTNPATGARSVVRGRLLGIGDGPVVAIDGAVHTDPGQGFVFDSLPEGLRARPTLTARVSVDEAGPQTLRLVYLTGGLSWQADYVAELTAGGDRLDLRGRASITNATGTDFPAADLRLAAGEVTRVADKAPPRAGMRALAAPMAEARAEPDMAEQRFVGAHLYDPGRPVTLRDGQTRQLTLLAADGIATRREHVSRGAAHLYRGRQTDPVEQAAAIEQVFTNDQGPLPAGVVRVFARDAEGRLRYAGAEGIGHTAAGEEVRLGLGRDFDLPVTRVQTDFARLSDRVYETAQRITLRNAGESPAVVRIEEPIPGDWQVVTEDRDHDKAAGGLAAWTMEVPSGGTETLTYRVRVRF